MPPWAELAAQAEQQGENGPAWLQSTWIDSVAKVSRLREGRNVFLYASAFLQKPAAPPPLLQLTLEDINGLMAMMHGIDCSRGLTLILHTPGGVINATEPVVDYLRAKFKSFEVIVPTYAMSAGTMIALASNRVFMARQSQLGPIDAQMPAGGRYVSARSVVDQFVRARTDISGEPRLAHLWAPILATIGPGLLQEALNALEYGERMVADWLERGMFVGMADAAAKAKAVAEFFNAAQDHKSHGRRIDRDSARSQGVVVEDL